MQADFMIYLGAMALGALHAFEPGHGKSIIAAYMIGTKGRAIDGIILGFIVTFTHTFSVIILGIIARMLSHSFTDAQLHVWLGFFSSLLILGVGLWMLRERLVHHGSGHTHFHFFCKEGADHDHVPAHAHSHPHPHDHGHDHDSDHHHKHAADHAHTHRDTPEAITGEDGRVNRWRLLMLGISGGIVPCPPAIVALLAAIGAGRTAEGLTVAIFFSIGLGLVMMTIGVVLSQAGRLTRKVSDNLPLARKLGILSALIITVLGCITLFHSIRGMLS
jgi:nickel/cobalt exporter